MSNDISPIFGTIVCTRYFKFQADSLVAVMEQFLKDRWIILHRLRDGKFVVLARYILFDSWNSLQHITRRYAPIVDVGVSLEDPAQYIVVEQSHIRYLLVYLVKQNGIQLLKQYEMAPTIRCNTVSGGGAANNEPFVVDAQQQERVAAEALARIQCINSIIIERTMVTTLYERLAFIIEVTPQYKWLFVYTWLAGMWHKKSQYEALDAIDRERTEITPYYCTDVSEMFQQYGDFNNTIIVVEQTKFIRWWHTYLWTCGSWKYSMSHHSLICRIIDLDTN